MKINKKALFFSAVFFLFSSGIFAEKRGAQELIRSGSKIYDLLTAISTETGIVTFYEQSPFSIAELKLYLNEIDYDSLSLPGKKAYDSILDYIGEEYLSYDSDILSLGIKPELNFESYYKTNESIDWNYNRFYRKPFFITPVTFSGKDYFTMTMDLPFSQNKGFINHHNNYINIPFLPEQMDINFPDNAYLSAGFPLTDKTGINFQLGRGSSDFGRSLNGSVIKSRYLTGINYGNFEIYSPNIRFVSNVSQYYVDKYMYAHQLDIRLFNKLQFTALESMLVYAPMELRFLNPYTIFHGMAPWKDYGSNESNTCAYMCFTANYTPIRNFRVYGIFAQDQFQTKYERDHWPDDVTPNGLGFELGVESFIPAGNGYIHTWAEGYYGDTYLYIKESPNWSLVKTYQENIGDIADFYEWIGCPYGPDTIAAKFFAAYEVPSKYEISITYLFKAAGEYSGTKIFNHEKLKWGGTDTDEDKIDYGTDGENWVFPVPDDKRGDDGHIIMTEKQKEAKRKQSLIAPSGIAEFAHIFSINAIYNINEKISLKFCPSMTVLINQNNIEGKKTFGSEVIASIGIKF